MNDNKVDEFTDKTEKVPYRTAPIFRGVTSCEGLKQSSGVDKTIFRVVASVAVILFCLNVFLVGLVYFNVKNNIGKNLNINYYNLSVSGDGTTSYAVQSAWQSSVCVAAGGFAYDEKSFFNQTSSRGSGVIFEIDSDENFVYIMTCYHVISGYEGTVYVLFSSSGSPVSASVVGYTESYDIAVLKAKLASDNINYAAVNPKNSQLLSIGESVFAVGNSLSGGLSVTSGVISRLNKEIIVEGELVREIQTDASINPGNSGGGLFNSFGQFVGIVNAKLSSTSSQSSVTVVEGTAFAIPGTFALSIAKSIVKNTGKPSYIDLGVTFSNSEKYISTVIIDGNIVEEFEVRVSSVAKNSISSGILQVNDIVLSFSYYDLLGNLQEVEMTNKYCFEDIAFDIMLGTDIEFNIIRPLLGEYKSLIVTASVENVQN